MRQTYLIACLLIAFAVARPVAAQTVEQRIDPALEADIVTLLNVLDVTNMAEQISNVAAQQMVEGIRRANPDTPPRVLSIIAETVRSKYSVAMKEQGGLISQIVPIYAKYYTREDIQALIMFYRSEVGRKAISTMPAVLQESMALSQRWAAEIIPSVRTEVEKRLREEGIR